ncbi:Uncharacterized protein M6B38_230690 [Iris pallida]|uniref:Coiled-coil SMC6 And NSE5 INteracting (CANIN) domain-containing protein n=1 Tax=Iris pallida TaxID=29817 RepID=A0AAX6DS35_IRIPA|nr:Uncharacterized protein M6B38_230690 [Iris pallida]
MISSVIITQSKSKRSPKGLHSQRGAIQMTRMTRPRSSPILVVNRKYSKVEEISNEDEIPLWGQTIFGNQKPPPAFLGPVDCEFLQSLLNNELNTILELDSKQGESFLEGLLINGWLSKLSMICGFVEDSVASWTFHKLLYSSHEELQVSSCDFWCGVLLSKNEENQPLVRLGWFPTYSLLNGALQIYGYISDTSEDSSSISNTLHTGCEGPPQNIISWLKVVSACCKIRSIRAIFSSSEAEDFLIVIFRLLLDRQLQGLSFILHECLESVVGFFSESEWDESSKKVSRRAAYRIHKDFNCVRIVESISGISSRSKNLRSQVALQILLVSCNRKVSDGEGVIKFITSINVKDKKCDIFKLYLYLVLAENWLLSYQPVDEDDVILRLWYKYLRVCSSQITSSDWRSYASKVRNKASYLLQNSVQRGNIV